jgi:hypothetical protein
VLKAVLGFGGLAMCLTLLFRGMRAVLDVGGACADGGPYVSAQPCPEGAPVAMLAGILGGFLFGSIAMVYGGRLGGVWGFAPVLAWTALFASLGWNFLDYGLFNPPPEADGIIWGWVACGVLFEVMAFAPLLLLMIPAVRGAQRGGGGPPTMIRPRPMRGPGMTQATRVVTASSFVDSGVATVPATDAEKALLQDIVEDMGAVITQAAATTPADPLARLAVSGAGVGADLDRGAEPAVGPGSAFPEGTQALLDRLERLGDMRDRGLLTVEEFEAAKATIVAELETRA